MAITNHNVTFYDDSYRAHNYFGYRAWLYRPYVSALITVSQLERGSSVLDVGCGQGFFSHLFRTRGMNVHGIDISETGVQMAQKRYGHLGITFSVSDIQTAAFAKPFDCIFVRSCSLYNTPSFPDDRTITDALLKHLRIGGRLVFAYNSNFSSRLSPAWRYHSLEDARHHFSAYPNARIFFLNRITTYLLRRYAFNSFVTQMNALFSRASGMGGDVICIVKKTDATPRGN